MNAPVSFTGVPAEYETLAEVLAGAIEQAAFGKGKERHALGEEYFENQKICEIGRRVGYGYQLGQAIKKAYEAPRLPGQASVRELHGAINYLAATIILMEEEMAQKKAEAADKKKAKDDEAENTMRFILSGGPLLNLAKDGTDTHTCKGCGKCKEEAEGHA